MIQKDYILNLIEILKLLDESLYWLKRSYDICHRIGIRDNYTDEELDAFEVLTSRFARISDIIIQKVFRGIDKVEFEDKGTLIDAINRAHKRGLFDSIDEIRVMKDLRNSIAHEYVTEDLEDIFKDVLQYIPQVFVIINNIKTYCQRYQVTNK